MGKKLTALDQLKTSMARAKGWASNQVAQVAQAAAEAMEEMDAVKADKSEGVAVTIPTTGWDETKPGDAYPYYYDIAADGVTAKDRADLALAPASIQAAVACGMCPATETLAGAIRVRAAKTPEAEMSGEYWVMKGKG